MRRKRRAGTIAKLLDRLRELHEMRLNGASLFETIQEMNTMIRYLVSRGRSPIRIAPGFDLRRLESHGDRAGLIVAVLPGTSGRAVEATGDVIREEHNDLLPSEAEELLRRHLFHQRTAGSRARSNIISAQVSGNR